MPSEERDGLVSGPSSSKIDGASKTNRVNKFRGLICWGIFGAFLIFFIIMTAVYTDPKRYKEATVFNYLSGEDAVLYRGLGQVYYKDPSTKKLNAMGQFQLGLLLLNVFWYDLAIQKFQAAQARDPDMVMAYWGEAMCYKQPLWQTENVQAAQAVLDKLSKRQILATAPFRERRYVEAVQVLFAPNATLQKRETDYAAKMMALSEDFPDDADGCALTGLSQLGQVQSVGGYAAASRSLLPFARDKLEQCAFNFDKHAGAWHYLTHVYDIDDPTWAAEGKDPALTLAKLAPKSNVAQHMVSHIFIRFGNWTEVVESNQKAVAASDEYCAAVNQGYACDADNRWHALEWQLYGQTQQCGAKAAYKNYMQMQTVAAAVNYTGVYAQWLYRSYAHMQLQSLGYLGIIPLKTPTDNATSMLPAPLYDISVQDAAGDITDHFWPPHAEAYALLARVYSLNYGRNASQLQDQGAISTTNAALSRLNEIIAWQTSMTANASAASSVNVGMLTLITIAQLQAQAVVGASACAANMTSCNMTSWISLMESALAMHTNISGLTTLPSLKIAPTPEFYGNLIIATNGNTTVAANLFRRCLTELPGRMQCVLGLAVTTKSGADQLVSQCSVGDKDFPALIKAQKLMLSAPPPSPPKRSPLRRAVS